MIGAYLLIYIPILLFVIAFLYETFISFQRLRVNRPSMYLDATWEVTNTLLVFGVVMLLMLFTRSIDVLADVMFTSTFLAGTALLIRSVCYIYIFYIKRSATIGILDWLYAFANVAAALLLVVTVARASWVLATKHPIANLQFIPYFLPGLVFVLALCSIPLVRLYRTK